jgi:hypothetical protein
MKTHARVLAHLALLCCAGGAYPQSSDAFIKQRDAITQAKQQYKSGEITREQYDLIKWQAKRELQASGQRGIFERNLDAPQPRRMQDSRR